MHYNLRSWLTSTRGGGDTQSLAPWGRRNRATCADPTRRNSLILWVGSSQVSIIHDRSAVAPWIFVGVARDP
jgi:hypothetical protein